MRPTRISWRSFGSKPALRTRRSTSAGSFNANSALPKQRSCSVWRSCCRSPRSRYDRRLGSKKAAPADHQPPPQQKEGYGMAITLKDKETDRLAREVAALTGESLTDAVRNALAQRLERER